jgi:hypothetical protein
MAEDSGHAPQSHDGIRPVSNGRPPLAVLPSRKWRRREVTLPIPHEAERSGFKPAPILDRLRLLGPRDRRSMQRMLSGAPKVLDEVPSFAWRNESIAPASVRLEGGCLICCSPRSPVGHLHGSPLARFAGSGLRPFRAAALRRPRGEIGPRGGILTRSTAFEARNDICINTQESGSRLVPVTKIIGPADAPRQTAIFSSGAQQTNRASPLLGGNDFPSVFQQ